MGGGTWQPLGPGLSLHSCSLCAHRPVSLCPAPPLPRGRPGGGSTGPPAASTALNSDDFCQQWLPSFAQILLPGAANQALRLLL